MGLPITSEVLTQAQDLARQALAAARGKDPAYPLTLYDRALTLLSPLGPNETVADILRWKGNVFRDYGDHSSALDMYAQSLAISDAKFYTVGRAHALNCIGTIEQCRGDFKRAISWYRAAQRLADGLGDRRLLGMIEQNLGIASATSNHMQEALEHFRAAQKQFEQSKDDQSLLWVLNNLGNLYTRQQSYQQAAEALKTALQLARTLGDVASVGIVEENWSRLLLATRQSNEAEEAARRALQIAEQRGDPTRQAAALCAIAQVMRARKEVPENVVATLKLALTLAQTGGDVETKGEIMRAMSQSYEDRGDSMKAKLFSEAAQELENVRLQPAPAEHRKPCVAAAEPTGLHRTA
jgi:tetratricopeptide (TPR) repeat protein